MADETQTAPAVKPVQVPVQVRYVHPPVRVDNQTRRSDADALEGSAVKVLSGEHENQIGVFTKVLEHGDDGYPTRILLRFQDATYSHEFGSEDYSNVRPVNHPGYPTID